MTHPARYTIDDVRVAVAASRSMTDVLRRLGLRAAGGNFGTVRRLVAEHQMSTDHFDPNWTRRGPLRQHTIPLEDVLVEHSRYDRRRLKRRLYEAGLKQRACEMCGQGERWHGRSMSLILDHINGVHDDNRLANLRIVCPNCNATLDTHCGRNNRLEIDPRQCLYCGTDFIPKRPTQRYCSHMCGVHSPGPRRPNLGARRVERPAYDQLKAELAEANFCAVARKYKVTDNAIRKWVRQYEREEEPEGGRLDR